MYNKKEISIPIQNEGFQFTLRTASEGDLPNLRKWKNNEREFFFFKNEISLEQQREWFRAYLSRTDDYMFVILVNKNAIGCMGIRLIEGGWDVYNVILGSKDFGSKGLMSKAFKAMLQFAVSNHQYSITLKVLKHNPAIEWYKKNGFTITSEQSDHFCMSYQP